MGRCIVKIKDRYFLWSTVVDAPISYGMDKHDIKMFLLRSINYITAEIIDISLERADENGCSFPQESLEEILMCNRAGDDETELTAEEIYDKYV